MSFGATNSVSQRISKPGNYTLSTATRGVQYQKGRYVLVPLANDKGEEYAVSAGVTAKGKPYDTLSITARTLSICTPELERVNTAKAAGKSTLEGLLVKLAHAIAKHFKSGQKVDLEYAKKDGKIIKGEDGKPRLNFK
jgi:hypothetical protein